MTTHSALDPPLAASSFDPFHVQKLAGFNKSRSSMASMATAVEELIAKDIGGAQASRGGAGSEEALIKEALYQVTHYSVEWFSSWHWY